MNVTTETMIDDGTEGCAWGMTPAGNPVLAVWKHGRRARIELTIDETKAMSMGGIFTAMYLEQQKSPAQRASSVLVTPAGLPIPTKDKH